MGITRILALTSLLFSAACGGAPERPNIVLITMDTTRADYLSCYGYPQETTPNLDRLAAEGVRFDLAMSTAAVTPVSHSSILTGRFNRDHGVRVIFAGSGFRLGDDVPTLATVAQAAGYKTIAVHSAFPVSPYFGLTRGFDVVHSFDTQMAGQVKTGKATWDMRNTRRSDETTELVLAELKRTEGPFLLWIHYWDPHDPIQLPPKEFYPPIEELYEFKDGRQVFDTNGNPVPQRPTTAMYAAEIRYMDSQIGRVLDHLRAGGDWDNTLVAVTADHGQGLGDHGWAAHRILYQEQIRVPLILHVPGALEGHTVTELVRTVDIAPTLLDYADLAFSASTAGRTLRPLLEGGTDGARLAFAEQINLWDTNAHMTLKRPHDDLVYCAMDTDWKLVWRPNHPEQSELFHIAADPRELDNLFAREHPEAIRLGKELGKHSPWVTEDFPASAGGADQELAAAHLAALGYMAGAEGEESETLATIAWDWICADPAHADQRSLEQGRCGTCQSPLILIARGK